MISRHARRGGWLTAATLLAAAIAPLAPAAAASDEDVCAALDRPVYEAVKPSNGASLYTLWETEAQNAADKYGFTDFNGPAFNAARSEAAGLAPVYRTYRSATNDFLFTTQADDSDYVNKGVAFYASTSSADCLSPVGRYRKGTKHRLAVGDTSKAALVEDGWTFEQTAFYTVSADEQPAPPPVGGDDTGKFSFAVIPDTQMEVVKSSDPRMVNRTSWLVKQPGLAFVDHTGDVVNWDTADHAQYEVAEKATDVLHDAGVPYSLSIGNHDTQATGVGGAARDPANTYKLQRDTSTFNDYYTASDYGSVGGAYEAGKVDNTYSTYEAGGAKWMILNLEFCARPGAVAWAKSVVESHPDHNVLVSTHSYLNGSGAIDSSNQGYGDTSGQKLFDQLISQYPNVKMVFSGHVGYAEKARVDRGKDGHKIYSFLTSMHDPRTNPTRMMQVDVANDTLKTYIYAPYTNQTWSEYTETLTGMGFIR